MKHCLINVLDFIEVKQILAKHIVKRWTKDARGILPAHLSQYPKENISRNPFLYLHFNMYMRAMELVRLGDTNVDAYEHVMSLFKNNMLEMKPFAEIRNGILSEPLALTAGCLVTHIF